MTSWTVNVENKDIQVKSYIGRAKRINLFTFTSVSGTAHSIRSKSQKLADFTVYFSCGMVYDFTNFPLDSYSIFEDDIIFVISDSSGQLIYFINHTSGWSYSLLEKGISFAEYFKISKSTLNSYVAFAFFIIDVALLILLLGDNFDTPFQFIVILSLIAVSSFLLWIFWKKSNAVSKQNKHISNQFLGRVKNIYSKEIKDYLSLDIK